MACSSTTSNPALISVEKKTKLHIVCIAHAAYYQKVILSFNSNMSNPIGTFVGTGENVGMNLTTGGSLLTVSTGSNGTLYAQFQYSSSGSSGPFQNAVNVCSPVVSGTSPNPVIVTVTSEDSTDNDDNDSYLTVIDLNA